MPISDETKLLFEYLKNYDGLIPVLNDIFDLTQGYVFEHRLHKPLNYELTEENIKPIMLDFYGKYYTRQKAEEVRDILSGNSTYFTGSDGYHVNFVKGKGTGSVSFHPENDYAEFFVYIDKNCLNVLKITAHELSHAISSHNKNVVTCAREHKKRDTNFHPEHDAISEVESYITEALFLNYMLSKGMITIDDGLDYYREGMSFIHNVIGEAFGKKVDKIELEGEKLTHKFRYVYAPIVASQWAKRYVNCPIKNQKEMMSVFCDYLDTTHDTHISIDDVCKTLLGKDFISVAKDFKTDLENTKNEEKVFPKRKYGVWDRVKSKMMKSGQNGMTTSLFTKPNSKEK